MNCPLCDKKIEEIYFFKKKTAAKYYQCFDCQFIFLDSRYYLNPEQEHKHYLRHNNDIHDLRYQEFVMPLVNMIEAHTSTNDLGLDYGCGPGPVIAHLLNQKKYQIKFYDLFFCDKKEVLNNKYDFIIVSEVAEHFQQPIKAFSILRECLNPSGKIFIMTALTDHLKDFASWHYHRDPSHVSFFSTNAFEVLCNKLGFNIIDNDKKKSIAIQKK